ncbi:hypothetical protein BpHYR1_005675 [Brachionus plicatilis]|uniref:Uncharacterized protein n=1 Tax=Brachionus plicatilis TaxID=10195 RepID=A0A3M7PKE5_BRAPC|nr:hypothetical protein BpHYR1_005675 [Brachionus plicatilis]
MLTELDQFFLVTSLPPAVNWVRPYWISRETLTLCYCLRMLGKWGDFWVWRPAENDKQIRSVQTCSVIGSKIVKHNY